MAIVSLYGSRIMTGLAAFPPVMADPGEGGEKIKVWVETLEVGSANSATSIYSMARIPSNARIMGSSRLHHDDLASSGSPTLDIGVFALPSPSGGVLQSQYPGYITDDADALNDGIDAAASGGASVAVIKDKANYGKQLWEFINGQTTDPKGLLDIKVSLLDADVNVGGTITLELHYTI